MIPKQHMKTADQINSPQLGTLKLDAVQKAATEHAAALMRSQPVEDVSPLPWARFEMLKRILDQEHGIAVQKLEARLEAFQRKCKHPHTVHHPDPAGDSSSSYWECTVCGIQK
jgi:hypothetical protein